MKYKQNSVFVYMFLLLVLVLMISFNRTSGQSSILEGKEVSYPIEENSKKPDQTVSKTTTKLANFS